MMKFKIGDIVEVVNYGHYIYGPGDEKIDISKESVGDVGIIVKIIHVQGYDSYSIHFNEPRSGHKTSWFNEDQLKKINI